MRGHNSEGLNKEINICPETLLLSAKNGGHCDLFLNFKLFLLNDF